MRFHLIKFYGGLCFHRGTNVQFRSSSLQFTLTNDINVCVFRINIIIVPVLPPSTHRSLRSTCVCLSLCARQPTGRLKCSKRSKRWYALRHHHRPTNHLIRIDQPTFLYYIMLIETHIALVHAVLNGQHHGDRPAVRQTPQMFVSEDNNAIPIEPFSCCDLM